MTVLPGKQYTFSTIVQIVRRRKWALLIPLAAGAAGTMIGSRFLPDLYTSEAVILVVPQRVPENFVRPTVTVQIEDRIRTISQEIMSRSRLETIIEELDLYPEERRTQIMEDVVAKMRLDITVNIPRTPARHNDGGSSFRVGYSSPDPRRAMQVTERLAALFIQENLRDREVMAEGTDQFLESQLEEARQRLLENEKRLEQYRKAHAGELPSQLQSNIQVLQTTQGRLQASIDSANRDRDRLVALDRLIADAEVPIVAPVRAQVRPTGDAARSDRPSRDGDAEVLRIPPGSAGEQLEAARTAFRELEVRLKPQHPDIQRARRLIQELERKAEAEALQQPLGPAEQPAPTPEERARRNRLAELQAEKMQLSSRVVAREAEQARMQKTITGYQARIEAMPTRESELVALNRDYETMQERYRSLLTKREDAKIAANLERRQIGEQFKLIEPARMPQKPVSPNRTFINLMGALIGLGVGAGLVALLEYRDTTLRTGDDVVDSLSLPVLAQIPIMTTSGDRRRRIRMRVLLSLAAVAGLMAGIVVVALKWIPWHLTN